MRNKSVDEYLADRFRRRISIAELDNPRWEYRRLDGGTQETMDKIEALLAECIRIKTGWISTSVRGFHEYVIMWKPKKIK